MRKFQLVFGLVITALGIYEFLHSAVDPTILTQGILIGQGFTFVLWGLREIAGSFSSSERKTQEKKE